MRKYNVILLFLLLLILVLIVGCGKEAEKKAMGFVIYEVDKASDDLATNLINDTKEKVPELTEKVESACELFRSTMRIYLLWSLFGGLIIIALTGLSGLIPASIIITIILGIIEAIGWIIYFFVPICIFF